MAFIVNCKAVGLYNNINELNSPSGALSVADNVLIGKDDIVESRPGFEACQTGLPTAAPLQMFTGKGRLFLHIDNKIYIKGATDCSYTSLVSGVAGIGSVGGFWKNGSILYFTERSPGNVIRFLNTSNNYIGTLAGQVGVSGNVDALGTLAKFGNPQKIWGDGTYLYICDYGNGSIRKMQLSNGNVTTLTTIAGGRPTGIWGDGVNLYVPDTFNVVIWKIVIATGVASVFAGSGFPGSADGVGAAASFVSPIGVASDGTYLYVFDSVFKIRKIEIATATVSTVFTSVVSQFDGIGYDNGYLYYGKGTLPRTSIYRYNISGNTEALYAGDPTTYGNLDGTTSSALFSYPNCAYCQGGSVYDFDYGSNMVRRTDISTGNVSTIGGTYLNSTISDGFFGYPIIIGPE